MFQVRIHGRGGQGVAIAAELLSVAAFSEGQYAQVLPGLIGAQAARMHPGRLLVVPATQFALDHLGRPLPGAALLGGFAALTGQVRLDRA